MEEKVSVPTLSNIENLVDTDMLYIVAEVSKILKTNTSYVYSLIKAGLIPALKLGSLKYVDKLYWIFYKDMKARIYLILMM